MPAVNTLYERTYPLRPAGHAKQKNIFVLTKSEEKELYRISIEEVLP